MRVTVHRQRPHDLLLSLIACCATVLTPDASHAAGSPSVMVSMAQLRTLGIALDLSAIAPAMRVKVPPGADRPFPNRCFGMVTVSDELLRQMQAQGFSLATLCIGLDSPHVAFHPETGAPLTSIRVRYGKREKDGPDKILELLIQVPRCFARGDPYGDCKMRYGWMEGERHQKDEVDYFARSGKRIAELMRLMNAKGAFQRECSCTDFRVPDTDFDLGPEPREGIICKATKEPACPRPLSRFSTPGSMVYDMRKPHGCYAVF